MNTTEKRSSNIYRKRIKSDIMKQMLKTLERVTSDNEWFQKNYLKLKTEYKNEFIAIKDKKIIAHGKDFDIVIKILKDKKENPALILIEFVTEKGVEIIL